MALEFRRRRFFRRPDKNGQLAIAIAAVVLGLCIAAAWIAISFREQPSDANNSSNTSESVTADFKDIQPVNLLVMLTDEGYERFTLVQIDPAAQRVRVEAVPADLPVADDSTLAKTIRKNGVLDATRVAAEALQLPIKHYIALTGEQAEKWFNYLESGIVITLPQAVDFTDTAGAVVRLTAGEHNLTATQTVALLRYNGWSDNTAKQQFAAEMLAAMINQYAVPGRRFSSDFASLSNIGRTSLRIGDFNNFLPALQHTVAAQDTLCVVEPLPR